MADNGIDNLSNYDTWCRQGYLEFCGLFPSPAGSPGGSNPVTLPQIITTPGGTTFNTNTLQSILGAITSSLAIVYHSPNVPTTVSQVPYGQSVNQGGLSLAQLQQLQLQQGLSGSGGNLAGGLQNLIQKNPGTVAIGVLIVAALFLKPVAGRR